MKTFEGSAEIITKEAKDLVLGDITALNGTVTNISNESELMSISLTYPSGNTRNFLWSHNKTIRLK